MNLMNTDEEVKSYNSRNADKFVVRLPEGMRQRIAEVAKNYHRSMNSEIVSRLESSLRTEACIQHEFDENTAEPVSENKTISLELTTQEFALIEKVRQLSAQKQQAIIDLLAVSG
jgi:plasmid stability protein